MGSLHISRFDTIETLSEIVGYKAGLVLEPIQLRELLLDYDAGLADSLLSDEVEGFRFHSSEFQAIVAHLLFKVGNIDDPSTMPPNIKMFHRVKKNPAELECYNYVMECYLDFMKQVMADPPAAGGSIDPDKFLRAAAKGFGRQGLDMAMEVIAGVNHELHISPWGSVRAMEWKDTAQLSDLFKNENLETQYGRFFDQRFIDFLHANFNRIGDIHWRKFEGLAGEFFDREGFEVDMGPGRNDGGIDLRVFPKNPEPSQPPLIIVQCKRVKEKIGKTLLKSVFADVLHEKAKSGLIVTSSWLSPGADELRTVRNYPVETADRDSIRDWITKMKTERFSAFG